MFPQKFLVFFLLLCSTYIDAQVSEPAVTPRIWSGTDVPDGKWPFVAEIRERYSKNRHLCGAAVLNDDTVITAAHCLVLDIPLQNHYLHLGHTKWDPVNADSVYNVSKFIVHTEFNNANKVNDIGLIKLDRKIDFTKEKGRISKVCLPRLDTEPDGSKCVALGWGETEQGKDEQIVLQEVILPIVPCQSNPKSHVCAGYSNKPDGICYGDSGGPLICPAKDSTHTYLLYGLSSYIMDKCGKGPGGFTKVTDFLNWIRDNAEA